MPTLYRLLFAGGTFVASVYAIMLALTVFVWVFLLNSMDFLPVDLLPTLWQKLSGNPHAYLRVVPTADLSTTLGLAVAILA